MFCCLKNVKSLWNRKSRSLSISFFHPFLSLCYSIYLFFFTVSFIRCLFSFSFYHPAPIFLSSISISIFYSISFSLSFFSSIPFTLLFNFSLFFSVSFIRCPFSFVFLPSSPCFPIQLFYFSPIFSFLFLFAVHSLHFPIQLLCLFLFDLSDLLSLSPFTIQPLFSYPAFLFLSYSFSLSLSLCYPFSSLSCPVSLSFSV